MSKTTLTPTKVKVIESALEERKSRADRRKIDNSNDKHNTYSGPERRSGQDRRND